MLTLDTRIIVAKAASILGNIALHIPSRIQCRGGAHHHQHCLKQARSLSSFTLETPSRFIRQATLLFPLAPRDCLLGTRYPYLIPAFSIHPHGTRCLDTSLPLHITAAPLPSSLETVIKYPRCGSRGGRREASPCTINMAH